MSTPLPRNEKVLSWGMNLSCRSQVLRPRDRAELEAAFATARRQDLPVAFRGAGCSYGDPALIENGLLIDFSKMRKVLHFDSEMGAITVEPGATIEDVWRHALPHRWWPTVVPGTMKATLGGGAAMNIHGKNNFCTGTLGESIKEFEMLLVDGSSKRCSPAENSELYHAAIGGFGMLGAFTSLTYKLKKVQSGRLKVRSLAYPNLEAMVEAFEERYETADYLVGWLDGYTRGESLGRGLIHEAFYLKDGEDPDQENSFSNRCQELSPRILGVFPRSWIWLGLWAFLNRPGMRLVNALKYRAGVKHQETYLQPLVAFSFLLDYVPRWKNAYKPGGLVQYQSFVPKDAAVEIHSKIIRSAQERGLYPYLGVLKKHREDPFLMTHAVDGYSLALDFPFNRRTEAKLRKLAADLDPQICEAGGRFYFAKDSLMSPQTLRNSYPERNIERFLALKRKLDPEGRLQSELFRRLFPDH